MRALGRDRARFRLAHGAPARGRRARPRRISEGADGRPRRAGDLGVDRRPCPRLPRRRHRRRRRRSRGRLGHCACRGSLASARTRCPPGSRSHPAGSPARGSVCADGELRAASSITFSTRGRVGLHEAGGRPSRSRPHRVSTQMRPALRRSCSGTGHPNGSPRAGFPRDWCTSTAAPSTSAASPPIWRPHEHARCRRRIRPRDVVPHSRFGRRDARAPDRVRLPRRRRRGAAANSEIAAFHRRGLAPQPDAARGRVPRNPRRDDPRGRLHPDRLEGRIRAVPLALQAVLAGPRGRRARSAPRPRDHEPLAGPVRATHLAPRSLARLRVLADRLAALPRDRQRPACRLAPGARGRLGGGSPAGRRRPARSQRRPCRSTARARRGRRSARSPRRHVVPRRARRAWVGRPGRHAGHSASFDHRHPSARGCQGGERAPFDLRCPAGRNAERDAGCERPCRPSCRRQP